MIIFLVYQDVRW